MALMDLSKAYDCLQHDLVAKLATYGFGPSSLALISTTYHKENNVLK